MTFKISSMVYTIFLHFSRNLELFSRRTIAPCGAELLVRWAGCDATDAFMGACHSTSAQALLQTFCVGTLEQEELDEDKHKETCNVSVPLSSAAAIERFSFQNKFIFCQDDNLISKN